VVALLIGLLAAGAVEQAAPAASGAGPRDACALLTPGEIRSVQGTEVKTTKRSEESSRGLHVAQCFFETTDFARSVNVTLVSDGKRYWTETFQRSPRAGRKNPPRPIAGAGDEALWTGDRRTGALYLLSGERVLRISVGGVADEEERIRRSKALALAAVDRLK
jgi:hypothetical protein